MKKIKWGNVGYLVIMLVGLIVIVHDTYKLALEPFFTGKLTQLTIFGIITLAVSFYAVGRGYDRLFK